MFYWGRSILRGGTLRLTTGRRCEVLPPPVGNASRALMNVAVCCSLRSSVAATAKKVIVSWNFSASISPNMLTGLTPPGQND
eukprot:1694184-Amphidinium_carterae.1